MTQTVDFSRHLISMVGLCRDPNSAALAAATVPAVTLTSLPRRPQRPSRDRSAPAVSKRVGSGVDGECFLAFVVIKLQIYGVQMCTKRRGKPCALGKRTQRLPNINNSRRMECIDQRQQIECNIDGMLLVYLRRFAHFPR